MKVLVNEFELIPDMGKLVIKTDEGNCDIEVSQEFLPSYIVGLSPLLKPKMDVWDLVKEFILDSDVDEYYIKENFHGDFYGYITIKDREISLKPIDAMVIFNKNKNINIYIESDLLSINSETKTKQKDPKIELQKRIKEAVDNEDFDKAAELQEELKNIEDN